MVTVLSTQPNRKQPACASQAVRQAISLTVPIDRGSGHDERTLSAMIPRPIMPLPAGRCQPQRPHRLPETGESSSLSDRWSMQPIGVLGRTFLRDVLAGQADGMFAPKLA